jgi:four helix bundle protein
MEKSNKKYILLKDLEIYQLARELSKIGWEIYQKLDWKTKKINGDQFIEATDSIGANIAEGYNRFHFLDKIKFYYNARSSLSEACYHWLEILRERDKINKNLYLRYKKIAEKLMIKLNNYISSIYQSYNENKNKQ